MANLTGAVQIVSLEDHSFHLELDKLKSILEADEIKDRYVVVVSIAGAFRKGKSFLMNFFIKYLEAQYKRHNISDWLGENKQSTKLNGFKWEGGRKPVTSGIWVWPEIFTHDYENGEKIAIVLLDTQGIFDHQSTVKECTTIFALSTLLASVQCYNVMQQVQEDNLQHLELFTEYGRLATEKTNEKPFQNLLFIIRDWQHADETGYGYNKQVNDEILTGNEKQSDEMRQLRDRITSNFEKIETFLMPFPGKEIANGSFEGNLKQINTNFLNYVKELIPSIFEPKNLTIKSICGQKVRARNLVGLWQTYLNVFKGDKLPEPKSIYMATAEHMHSIMFYECIDHYMSSMRSDLSFNVFNSQYYLDEAALEKIHLEIKDYTLREFKQKPKIGDDRSISKLEQDIESNIEVKFSHFKKENECNRENYMRKMEYDLRKATADFLSIMRRKIGKKFLKNNELTELFDAEKSRTLDQYKRKLRGGHHLNDAEKRLYSQLTKELDNLINTIININKKNETKLDFLQTAMATGTMGSIIGNRYGGVAGTILGGIGGAIVGGLAHFFKDN